jgi:glycosyltransferase involved in cell wall biosynthesis
MTFGVAPLRALWRRSVPLSIRQQTGAILQPLAIQQTLTRANRSLGLPGEGLPALVGFFQGASGIAMSAQLASQALKHLSIEHRTIDVGDLRNPSLPDNLSSSAWMFHLNPPELLTLWRAWGVERLRGQRFGYWAWELPKAPRLWLRTAAMMDGVMSPSAYVAGAFSGAKTTVMVTPHPLAVEAFAESPTRMTRPHGEQFRVVGMFDFKSSAARKNPEGAIEAFRLAFGDDPSVRLVVKTHSIDFAPDLARSLRERAGPNVEFIDAVWDRSQVLSFVASADAFLSLHRAEGFGLTLAEAMMLGTPVIATGWSGNLEFMSDETACLIPSRLVPIQDPQNIYRGQMWAEPDIEVAAAKLRHLRSDVAFGKHLARRARSDVAQRLSPESWLGALTPALRTAFLTP